MGLATEPRLWGCALAALIPLATLIGSYHGMLIGGRGERRAAAFLVAVLGVWAIDIHYSNVDLARYFQDGYIDNVDWQRQWHARALQLDPAILPHSYRILPDCFVAWLQLLTGNYLAAAVVLRLTCYWLTLALIYRLARRWFDAAAAATALLLFAIVYVPSIRYYGGQLTDPVSHLTFVLSFTFLFSGRFWLFLPTVALGVLAKESLLLMPLYAAIVHLRSGLTGLKWATSGVVAAGVALAIRAAVVGSAEYTNISGVEPDFFRSNITTVWHWSRQTWQSLGWPWVATLFRRSEQPPELLGLALFLTPCLWISNLFFSHLMEARNFIPAAIPLVIMAAHTLTSTLTAISRRD